MGYIKNRMGDGGPLVNQKSCPGETGSVRDLRKSLPRPELPATPNVCPEASGSLFPCPSPSEGFHLNI